MLRYSKERLAEERSITDIYLKAQLELDVRKELYEKFRRKLTDEELASLDDEDIKVPLERYIYQLCQQDILEEKHQLIK